MCLLGKLKIAVAALDTCVGFEYDDLLRKAVLKAYGSAPEAYRRQFRDLRINRIWICGENK